MAYPKKLEQLLHHKWPSRSIKVINLSVGGADENTWLGRLDQIIEHDPDVILVESAINDQCDYDAQDARAKFVNETSISLLNLLVNFPQEPAVISLELFRTTYGNNKDANRHCRGYVAEVPDRSGQCFYCPQWWNPPSWRQQAREYNSISQASYRDAVWPILEQPPDDLCSNYWDGMSHPLGGVHALVASVILFQFLIVNKWREIILQYSVQQMRSSNVGVPIIEDPKNVCLSHISSYRAMQGNSNDPFESNGNSDSCWKFKADSKQKYGWICEVENTPKLASHMGSNWMEGDEHLQLSKKIRIGGNEKVIISRLVSYDTRMVDAQVWFTFVNDASINIFEGDPVRTISSWHEEKTSIPQPFAIMLNNNIQFKNSDVQWPDGNGSEVQSQAALEVTFNLKMIPHQYNSELLTKTSKFKLLGIVTC